MTATAACVLVAALLAQEPRDLAALLQPIRDACKVPALAAAVVDRGTVVALGAVGVRRIGDTVSVGIDDVWHLGSCGKAMTATVLARFVERGRLRWDTSLADALPELAGAMHAGFRTATVRQLLQHRAGLPEDTSMTGPFFAELDRAAAPREQRRRIAALALAEAPASAAGTQHAYSNTGYVIAGAIAEHIADAPFDELLQRELFGPLDMTSAGCGPPGAGGEPAPWGHRSALGSTLPFRPQDPLARHPAFYAPAGDVHASLRHWARFVTLHLEPPAGEAPLLAAGTLQAMHAPVPGAEQAFGFTVTTAAWSRAPVLVQHGASPQWHAVVAASPRERIAFLAACNLGGDAGAAACDAAVTALAAEPRTRPK